MFSYTYDYTYCKKRIIKGRENLSAIHNKKTFVNECLFIMNNYLLVLFLGAALNGLNQL